MYRNGLAPGDPAPWFRQRSMANANYVFDTAAGRYLILCFFGTGADPHAQAAIAAARGRTELFDDQFACFFGVSNDPSDESEGRLVEHYPGYRFFWDFDLAVSKLYGAVESAAGPGSEFAVHRQWVVLDPTLRVRAIVPFRADRGDITEMLGLLETLPPPQCFAGFEVPAPVLILPDVLEPELCTALIDACRAKGSRESGFMRDVGGKTVAIHDHVHKRRRDYDITDTRMIAALQDRVLKRINPQIAKAYQFLPTRMERYIVAAYTAEDGGHFRAHRDNTTRGTAHRRFAVSINLNADFDGGALSFPEYGPRGYRMPAGGAAVFSCSLLHMVSPVTSGTRFAFLPFLYDDAAARIREANNPHLGEGVGAYQASKR